MVTRFKQLILLFFFLFAENIYAATSQHLSLLLDWHINPNHAPILVAVSEGYFKKYGLDVHLIEPSESTDQAKLVALNKADIAITYQPHYQQQRKHQLPIQQVGTLIPVPLDCLVYLPTSGIQSAKDLKGKRVGYSDASDEFVLLHAVLKSANLSMNDIELINVHYNLMQALMMGKIDLAVGMMRNIEPTILREKHVDPKMFYPEQVGIASYSELIFIARTGKRNAAIDNFFKALQEATETLQKNPDEAWQATIKTFPQLNTKTNYIIWLQTTPLFSLHPQVIS